MRRFYSEEGYDFDEAVMPSAVRGLIENEAYGLADRMRPA